MGIAGLWDAATDYTSTLTMSEFTQKFFKEHQRWPVVAMDMLPFYFEFETAVQAAGGSDIFHHLFIRRMRGFLKSGIIPIGVFDGNDKLYKLRHGKEASKRTKALAHNIPAIKLMKHILRSLGLQVVEAPSEGEAQCTKMQVEGRADFVFSVDSDCLVYGAQKVLQFGDFSRGKGLESRPLKVIEIPPEDAKKLNQWIFIVVAVLQGNDFSKGISKIGSETACKLATIPKIIDAFMQWFQRTDGDTSELYTALENELKYNESGELDQVWRTKVLNLDNLDRKIVEGFVYPKVHPSDRYAPAAEFRKLWRPPNYDELKRVWNNPSGLYIKGRANPKETTRKNVERDTIQVILTEIWCARSILMGTFKPEYVFPIKKPRANASLVTLKLSYEQMESKCSSVEDGMEIKLPIHLVANLPYEELPAKLKVKPSKSVRLTKAQKIAQSNHKIAFASRSASVPILSHQQIPQVSLAKEQTEPKTPPRQIIPTRAAPFETVAGIIDLTGSSPPGLIPPAIDLTDPDSPQQTIPTSIDLPDSPPPPVAAVPAAPQVPVNVKRGSDVVSITRFFSRRSESDVKRVKKK